MNENRNTPNGLFTLESKPKAASNSPYSNQYTHTPLGDGWDDLPVRNQSFRFAVNAITYQLIVCVWVDRSSLYWLCAS